MVHRPADIAAFTNGETALVYAARIEDPDGPLVFLPDGDADKMRAYTKSALQCFMPRCPTPSFTTVSRRDRRDGFRHLTGGNHEPESLFHRQTKQALVDWLNSTQPPVLARVEVPLPGRIRVADVLAETSAGRFAFEVQYASLTTEGAATSWQTRTDDYTAAGIQVEWLFGHHGVHLTALADATVGLNAVQTKVIAAGHRLWWINPTTSQVATAYVAVALNGQQFLIPPRPDDRTVHLAITPLNAARLERDGLHTAATDYLDHQADSFRKALQAQLARDVALEREREDAERRKAEQAALKEQKEVERAGAAARRREARMRRRAEREERATEAWHSSPTYRSVLAACDGSIPSYLDHSAPYGAVFAHHQHWQAIIYGVLIRGRVGSVIDAQSCLVVLTQRGIGYSPKARPVVTGWLHHLENECHLKRPLGGDHWEVTDPDLERIHRVAAETARQQHLAEERRARRLSEAAERALLQKDREERRQRLAATTPELARPARLATCRECGGLLDPSLAATGVHVLCRRPHRSFR